MHGMPSIVLRLTMKHTYYSRLTRSGEPHVSAWPQLKRRSALGDRAFGKLALFRLMTNDFSSLATALVMREKVRSIARRDVIGPCSLVLLTANASILMSKRRRYQAGALRGMIVLPVHR
jgi:hypothetical protein